MNELFYTLSFCAKSLSNVCFQLWHVSVQTSHVRVLHSHTRLVRLVSALPRVSLCCEAWTECLGVQGKEHLFGGFEIAQERSTWCFLGTSCLGKSDLGQWQLLPIYKLPELHGYKVICFVLFVLFSGPEWACCWAVLLGAIRVFFLIKFIGVTLVNKII